MNRVYNTNFVNGVASGRIDTLAREIMCGLSEEQVKQLYYISFGSVKDTYSLNEVDTMMDVFSDFINDIYGYLMDEVAEHLMEEAENSGMPL